MANGLPPVITGGPPPGTGALSGIGQGLGKFGDLSRDMAFFNLQSQRQQQQLQQESLIREDILQQTLAARAGEAELARQGQRDLAADAQAATAEQNRLNRIFQAKQQGRAIAAKKDKEDDPFDIVAKGTKLLTSLQLDPKDDANFQVIKSRDPDAFQDLLSKKVDISSKYDGVVTSKELQRQVFGRKLRSKEREQFANLVTRAKVAPVTFGPKLEQFIAQIKKDVEEQEKDKPRREFRLPGGPSDGTASPEEVQEAFLSVFQGGPATGPTPFSGF